MIIDAHQHFWRISRGDYGWMDDGVAPLRRDHLPPEFDAISAPLGVAGSVLVQAAPTEAETAFLLTLADASPRVLGVVGWSDLSAPARVTAMARTPHIVGLRPMLQDIADTDWIIRDAQRPALAAMAEAGLVLDALITPRHLPVIAQLADAIPDLRIVIDHCAKPVFDGADPGDAWRSGMSRLAAHPQIACKLSGLATEHGPGWGADTLRPAFAHVLDAFGPKRLIWGSDWPVLTLAGDYAHWLSAAQSLTASLPAADRAEIFAGAARRAYGLKGPAP